MKKTLLFLAVIISLLNTSHSYSMSCDFSEAITQLELDNFIKENPDCTILTDGLFLDISNDIVDDNIVDMSPLINIEKIVGDVYIFGQSTDLSDLKGLDNLKKIYGDLKIEVTGLESLNGLGSLEYVSGFIYIKYVDGIKDLNGLNSLYAIGDRLLVQNCSALESLNGLEKLSRIDGYGLYVQSNNNLTDISALSSTLEFTIEVEQPGVWIIGNSSLSNCNTDFLCKQLKWKAFFTIEENDEGCNSFEEVEEACIQASVDVTEIGSDEYTFLGSDIIEFNESISSKNISIYNSVGMEFTDFLIINNQSINYSKLNTGFYFLKVGDKILKLIVE